MSSTQTVELSPPFLSPLFESATDSELHLPHRDSTGPGASCQDALSAVLPTVPLGTVVPSLRRRIFHVAPSNVMGRHRKMAVTALIICANIVQMTSQVVGVVAGTKLSKELGVQDPSLASWFGASYPLTQGTFVLVAGRLGAVYGHKNILLLGIAWFVICSVANGFCDSFFAFNIARALSGLGGGLILPNAVAMLGITNPPGKGRNLALGFLGASAPMGGYMGSVLSGLFIEHSNWRYFFFTMAILGGIVFVMLTSLLPPEIPVDRKGRVDWIGAFLGTGGLIIFNFVWNQAPSAGWNTPYEIVLLVVSLGFLAGFAFWEGRFATSPIMPLHVWRAPSFFPLVLVTLLSFMSYGTMIWYSCLWQENVWHWTVLHFSLGWLPFGIFGTAAACLSAWLIPRLAAEWIMAIGTVSVLMSTALIATMPAHQSYWKQVFPATIVQSFCPDMVYTAAQIIASNSVRREEQGIAGSLVGILNLYGTSLGLGFAGTVEVQVKGNIGSDDINGEIRGYRAALYFGLVLGAIALLVDIFFVRMAKDDREGWTDPTDETELDTSQRPTATQTAFELES